MKPSACVLLESEYEVSIVGALMGWLEFTVRTAAFMCQSQRPIRRYQSLRCQTSNAAVAGDAAAKLEGDTRIDTFYSFNPLVFIFFPS